MLAIFAIFSWLFLVFSFVKLKNSLQILLLLAGGLLIVYQVSCLVIYKIALLTFFKGGYLLFYCVNCPRWLQWALLKCFFAAIISIVIVLSVSYTKVLKIILLLFFLVEYLIIFVVYLVTFLQRIFFCNIRSFFLQNIRLCYVAQVSAFGFLVAYLKRRLDFIMFL